MQDRLLIGWEELGRLAESLAELILRSGKRHDLVVGILRGGCPLALLVADRLGARVDFLNIKSYSGLGTRGAPRVLSTLTEDAYGKDVLIVDDLVDEGTTMSFAVDFVRRSHSPRSVETSALFVKPWSKFIPDYYVRVVREWVVFPWELCEFGVKECAQGIARGRA